MMRWGDHVHGVVVRNDDLTEIAIGGRGVVECLVWATVLIAETIQDFCVSVLGLFYQYLHSAALALFGRLLIGILTLSE